jgi:hypothetical protein
MATEQHVLMINIRTNARVNFTFFSNPNLVFGQERREFLTTDGTDETDDENDESQMMNDKDQRPANDVNGRENSIKRNHSRQSA